MATRSSKRPGKVKFKFSFFFQTSRIEGSKAKGILECLLGQPIGRTYAVGSEGWAVEGLCSRAHSSNQQALLHNNGVDYSMDGSDFMEPWNKEAHK